MHDRSRLITGTLARPVQPGSYQRTSQHRITEKRACPEPFDRAALKLGDLMQQSRVRRVTVTALDLTSSIFRRCLPSHGLLRKSSALEGLFYATNTDNPF